jgi:electron transfer flavoprotein alpha subunit
MALDRTWVFSEEVEGAPDPTSLELLVKARQLSGEVGVLYLGEGSDEAIATLGAHGATRVYRMNGGDALPSAPVAAATAGLVETEAPDLILFALAPTARDVAGRLAARLGRSVLSNAVDVTVDGGPRVVNEIFGGTRLVETVFTGGAPHLVVVRPKSFTAEESGGGAPEVTDVALPDAGRSAGTVTERVIEAAEGPQLEEAAVIVAGGRGIGSPEGFDLIEQTAAPLKAATGATRAIVDAGWVPYAKQVGQTGKTVKPDVYIAAGVSGAMQHLVGMKDSKIIIAVNKDPDAPIFGVADLGVVGDVHKVLPKLIEELGKRT